MAKTDQNIIIEVVIDYRISFWQAVKLRIAGKAYLPIAEKICSIIEESTKIQNEEKPE